MLESLEVVKAYLDQFCDNRFTLYEVFGGRTIVYRVGEDTGVVIASLGHPETDITVAATTEWQGHWEKHSENTVGVVDLHRPDSLERIKDLILGLISDINERKFNFACPQRGD